MSDAYRGFTHRSPPFTGKRETHRRKQRWSGEIRNFGHTGIASSRAMRLSTDNSSGRHASDRARGEKSMQITEELGKFQSSEQTAMDSVMPLVYQELKK